MFLLIVVDIFKQGTKRMEQLGLSFFFSLICGILTKNTLCLFNVIDNESRGDKQVRTRKNFYKLKKNTSSVPNKGSGIKCVFMSVVEMNSFNRIYTDNDFSNMLM